MALNPEPPLVIRQTADWSESDPRWKTPEGKAQIALCAKAMADRIDRDLAERVYREVYGR